MTAKANKNEAEELVSNLEAEQKQAEAALKETSKATRKKTVMAAKETGKTADVAMEKTSKKTTGKTASDATILKTTTAAKNINGTVGGKRRKAIDESANRVTDEKPDETPQKRPDKAIGERPDEAADKRVCKATGKRPNEADGESANKATDRKPDKTTGKRPDKATKLLKDAILKAAIKAGNQLGEDGLVSYLEAQALKNASSFLTLLGKVLPAELNNNGQQIKTVTKIELVAMKDPLEEKASRKDK